MELTKSLLDKYLKGSSPPYVSIFIPTHPHSTSQNNNEDRIRLKNALQNLHEQIEGQPGLKKSYRSLLELADDNDFWQQQSLSLAVFADQKGFATIQLPYELTPVACLDKEYAISPLAIMKSMGKTYYVLDLNFKQPKLYAGNAYELRELDDAELPGSIEDEIEITEGRQNSVGSRSGASGRSTIYYGHNEVDESRSHEATLYLRLLAKAADAFLHEKADPLILTGSPKVIAEFKDIVKYHNILDKTISVDYDAYREEELFKAASEVIGSIADKQRHEAVARYNSTEFELRADGQTAVSVAAEQGKVDTLLLPVIRVTTDGIRNDSTPAPLVELPDDFAAFESTVRKVIAQSGTVLAVEKDDFKSDPSMKAILRF